MRMLSSSAPWRDVIIVVKKPVVAAALDNLKELIQLYPFQPF